ncbi:MAG: DUF5719 family protein [Egibacteraceae bacterium]
MSDRVAPGAIVTLLALVALVGGVAAVEALFPSPLRQNAIIGQGPVSAGTWYCPVTAGQDEQALLTVAAVGREPSTVVLTRYEDRKAVEDPPVMVADGEALEVPLKGAEATQPIVVRWQGGPAVAHWSVSGAGDSAAAGCEPGPSQKWHVTGFDTTIGSKATLYLFNPYGEDAVARLRFSTPEGLVDLVIADNQLVPGGSSTPIDLSEFQPEESDLGVTVEVLTGRLVAQGQVVRDGGAGGRALLRGAPSAALHWDVAHVRADDTSAAWLSVQNPSDREAAIEVQVSDPRAEGNALLGEMSVPSGGLVRIDLSGVSSKPDFGLAVMSVNETPVVVSVFWTLRGPEGRGLAAALAAPGPSTEWALAGGGTAGRSGEVSIYNPGAEDATVTVLSPKGRLAEWSGLVVRPNRRVTVDLAAAGRALSAVPVRVVSDRPIVAELRSLRTTGTLELWTSIGVPAVDWTGPPTRPPVRLDPSLQTTAVQAPMTPPPDEFDPADLDLPSPVATPPTPGDDQDTTTDADPAADPDT